MRSLFKMRLYADMYLEKKCRCGLCFSEQESLKIQNTLCEHFVSKGERQVEGDVGRGEGCVDPPGAGGKPT